MTDWLLQSNTNNVRFCYFKLHEINVNKIRVISFCRKTNCHVFDYRLFKPSITRTDFIRDLGVLEDTTLYFHQQVIKRGWGYVKTKPICFLVYCVYGDYMFRPLCWAIIRSQDVR